MANRGKKRQNKQQKCNKLNELNAKYDANLQIMKKRNYLRNILVSGYLRPVSMNEFGIDLFILFSKDIELLCSSYIDCSVPKLTVNYHKFTRLHRKTNIMEIYFNEKFFTLYTYEQRMICCDILLNQNYSKYSTLNIITRNKRFSNDIDNQNQMQTTNYLSGIEYILSMFYSMNIKDQSNQRNIKCLDLSNSNLGDEDIWCLCNLIENITIYHQTKNNKSWILDLEEINLSNNKNVSDKYMNLFTQKICKYLPKLNKLNLDETSIPNKSISMALLEFTSNNYSKVIDEMNKHKQKKRKKKKYKSGNWMS